MANEAPHRSQLALPPWPSGARPWEVMQRSAPLPSPPPQVGVATALAYLLAVVFGAAALALPVGWAAELAGLHDALPLSALVLVVAVGIVLSYLFLQAGLGLRLASPVAARLGLICSGVVGLATVIGIAVWFLRAVLDAFVHGEEDAGEESGGPESEGAEFLVGELTSALPVLIGLAVLAALLVWLWLQLSSLAIVRFVTTAEQTRLQLHNGTQLRTYPGSGGWRPEGEGELPAAEVGEVGEEHSGAEESGSAESGSTESLA